MALWCLAGFSGLQAAPLALENQSVWFDSNGLAQAGQVWALPEVAFQGLKQANFGFEKRQVWLKLRLPPSETPRLLAVGFPALDWVRLYDRQANLVGEAGTLVPLQVWPYPARFPIFDLPPSAEEAEYLLQVRGDRALVLPLQLWDHADLHEHFSNDFLWFGLVFGALVIMLFYNGVLYFMVRQRAYLYYLVGLSGFLLLALALEGFGLLYLWPPQVQLAILPFGACLAQFGAMGFARYFLGIPAQSERLDRVVQAAMYFSLGLAIVALLVSSRWVTLAVTAWTLPSLALILFLGAWAAFRRQQEAGYYLAAWSLLALGALATAAEPLLRLPHQVWYRQAMYVGIILNLALLSLGLASQIRRLRAQREQAQAEVLAAKEQTINSLEESQATKDQLLATVSHELMTPIAGISGLVEVVLAEQGPALAGPVVRDLRLIHANAARLSHLVADILDFTKLRHSCLQVSLRPVSLWKCAEFVVAMSRPFLAGRPLELFNQVPIDFPAVQADERRLQQVLFNLVENACKYSESGQIIIRAIEEGETVSIEVADQGPGIAPDEWERLLLPFERGRSSQVQDQPGTGMGLALVRELVELHHGRLSCHAAASGGAVIRFSLHYAEADFKLADEAAPTLAEPPQTTTRSGRGAMILVVEDEPLSAGLIARILGQNGFDPIAVYSAAEALETLSEEPDIELVLLDVMMPLVDGFELCRRIREDHSPAALPVLFLTARTDPEDIAKGFEVGANDYIGKPIRHSELLARVNSQLRSKQLVSAMQENRALQREVERRRRMEGLLKSMRTRLTRILDGIPSPFLVFDHRGQLNFLNSAAEHFCGFELSLDQAIHFNDLAEPVDFAQAMSGDLSQVTLQAEGGEPCLAQLHRLPQQEDSEAALILTLAENGAGGSWPVHLGFQDAQGFLGSKDMKLLQETRLMPERLDGLQDPTGPGISAQDLAGKTAELMSSCLNLWSQYTGKDKLQLAEESGLWTVTAEASGTYRTRTLDRYLKSSALPKRPRWRNVLQTAYFVRQALPENCDDRRLLDQQLEQLEALLIRR